MQDRPAVCKAPDVQRSHRHELGTARGSGFFLHKPVRTIAIMKIMKQKKGSETPRARNARNTTDTKKTATRKTGATFNTVIVYF